VIKRKEETKRKEAIRRDKLHLRRRSRAKSQKSKSSNRNKSQLQLRKLQLRTFQIYLRWTLELVR